MSICCYSRKKEAPRCEATGRSIDDPHEEGGDDEGGIGMEDVYAWISAEVDSDGSDIETDEPSHVFERKRANAVCVEVYGAWNQRRAFEPPKYDKSDADKAALKSTLSDCVLFQGIMNDEEAMTAIVDAMSIHDFARGEKIFTQGEPGDAVYVILRGGIECYRETEGAAEPPPELPDSDKGLKGTMITEMGAGKLFGELAILWNVPRSLSVYGKADEGCSVGKLDRQTHQNLVVDKEMTQREARYQLLKQNPLLEMMTPEQISKLADVLKLRCYAKDENLITQNEEGKELFLMVTGEAVAKVATYFMGIEVDVQEHKRYHQGDLFGERALLRGDPRGASVTANSAEGVQALLLSRGKFERLLGSMGQLQEGQYLSDPRKLIADFYNPGNQSGPKGAVEIKDKEALEKDVAPEELTTWFAVYRPTSRDAIAKMLSGDAVGKGLNVKGKSAKRGVLSGFVPFLQISDNDHKHKIEEAPASSRIKLYFRSKASRDDAQSKLYAVMFESAVKVESKTISPLDDKAPHTYGIEVPEPVLIQAYIKNPNIVPRVGWETGRASEPAFMDLNMHAIRGDSEPKVVLIQFDEDDPMNPRGLLIAYEEEFVKPVVSDFDTFTVGSTQMKYQSLPVDQAELALWALNHTKGVLSKPAEVGWTGRWLEILKIEGEKGFHPEFPKYGFGDPTSYSLIGDVVTATISCGAVRHGAECFNFYFPQELDDEYLVIWEGFDDKPWDYKNEAGLREFLEQRIEENYAFPLNPIWPVRDRGWFDILEKMLANESIKTLTSAWDPTSTIIKTIQELHAEFPDGFKILNKDEPEERNRSTVPDMFGSDLMGCEKGDLAMANFAKHMKFKKAIGKVKVMRTVEIQNKDKSGNPTPSAPPETTAPTQGTPGTETSVKPADEAPAAAPEKTSPLAAKPADETTAASPEATGTAAKPAEETPAASPEATAPPPAKAADETPAASPESVVPPPDV